MFLAMLLRIGEVEIDEERFELRRGGQPVVVQRRVLELIVFLASNADRLVSKGELLTHVWQGSVVSDAAVAQAIKHARRVMHYSDGVETIVTIRGKGFRFEREVVSVAKAGRAAASRASGIRRAVPAAELDEPPEERVALLQPSQPELSELYSRLVRAEAQVLLAAEKIADYERRLAERNAVSSDPSSQGNRRNQV